ncbi:MAG: hypothetical protein WA655_20425 [Candidatus Korobacteraceae bacterium]
MPLRTFSMMRLFGGGSGWGVDLQLIAVLAQAMEGGLADVGSGEDAEVPVWHECELASGSHRTCEQAMKGRSFSCAITTPIILVIPKRPSSRGGIYFSSFPATIAVESESRSLAAEAGS